MGPLASVFCCCVRPKCVIPYNPSMHGNQRPHDPQAGFMQTAAPQMSAQDQDADDAYLPTVPLPRYTPRPMSLHEKTLEFEQSRSNDPVQDSEFPRDEKDSRDFDPEAERERFPSRNPDDHSSDASSTMSYPSSFGNTSTATRDTPPPPYSPAMSPAPSRRSMSMSISTNLTGMTYANLQSGDQPPSPMLHISQPQPVRHRQQLPQHVMYPIVDGRASWEGRRSTPPLPPMYSRAEH
ncbi:hypothetical protein AJ80_04677 [Polytolypa hystricis UAMH7299]|uniref:Uncharacterized protein n=1 Tax=Polytolypa hystricis (strain UAMH7299) TaxID=1447883 RepID=A0A2B7Y1A9_POLH7|nr:hypothetical protein AJ80_04677 [Polytolypa hystricis UAMH7299]